jgi:hypothetical protein
MKHIPKMVTYILGILCMMVAIRCNDALLYEGDVSFVRNAERI